MTALQLLKRRGPMTAEDIAHALVRQPEAVYAELVRADDAGKARINVVHLGDKRYCEWEAMEEVPA